MAVQQQGSNVVVNRSVAGSVFPTSERELVFPVLIDGSEQAVLIDGQQLQARQQHGGHGRRGGGGAVRVAEAVE